MSYKDRIWPHKAEDVPSGPHWAIIEFSSTWIPGDQRSIDAPGHGYPAHSEETVSYTVFTSREAWESEIQARSGAAARFGTRDWVAIQAVRAEIKTTVSVDVKVTT